MAYLITLFLVGFSVCQILYGYLMSTSVFFQKLYSFK